MCLIVVSGTAVGFDAKPLLEPASDIQRNIFEVPIYSKHLSIGFTLALKALTSTSELHILESSNHRSG